MATRDLRLRDAGRSTHVLECGGVALLFSYRTPVAYWRMGSEAPRITAKAHSVTTQKHITQWLRDARANAVKIPQEELERAALAALAQEANQ